MKRFISSSHAHMLISTIYTFDKPESTLPDEEEIVDKDEIL